PQPDVDMIPPPAAEPQPTTTSTTTPPPNSALPPTRSYPGGASHPPDPHPHRHTSPRISRRHTPYPPPAERPRSAPLSSKKDAVSDSDDSVNAKVDQLDQDDDNNQPLMKDEDPDKDPTEAKPGFGLSVASWAPPPPAGSAPNSANPTAAS
ncbi:hypothetical protein H0H93_013611, partial [Arthromyces matolae]